MGVYAFDTSGLVKRHIRETGSAWIRALTAPRAGHTIDIARITAVEIFAAITRRQRGGHITAAQAGAMLGHFRRQLDRRYGVIELTPSIVSDAMQLARKHGLRAYDAVQLASALEVD